MYVIELRRCGRSSVAAEARGSVACDDRERAVRGDSIDFVVSGAGNINVSGTVHTHSVRNPDGLCDGLRTTDWECGSRIRRHGGRLRETLPTLQSDSCESQDQTDGLPHE